MADPYGIDLFGNPVMQRAATFVAGNRVELHRRWAPGPIACMIGHNPADADADRDDMTTRWWIEWCRLFGFGGLVAVNLYPFVSADPADVYRIVREIDAGLNWAARDARDANVDAVVSAAKSADKVFACWGAIARDPVWIDHVVEAIQDGEEPWPHLWCWGKTKNGAPKHPMARGLHRIAPDQKPVLWRFAHG